VSNNSLITEGGAIALLELVPKKARTMSPLAVVVTEGAAKDRLPRVNAPL
jgi:hypothetical protein